VNVTRRGTIQPLQYVNESERILHSNEGQASIDDSLWQLLVDRCKKQEA